MLGRGLAKTGSFTRYPYVERFVTRGDPDTRLSTLPGGDLPDGRRESGHHRGSTGGAVRGVVCPHLCACRPRAVAARLALAAAIATALDPPLLYFAALVLTELWTTFIVVATILVTWKAVESQQTKWFVAAGFLFGYATLSRPVFVLLAPFMAG